MHREREPMKNDMRTYENTVFNDDVKGFKMMIMTSNSTSWLLPASQALSLKTCIDDCLELPNFVLNTNDNGEDSDSRWYRWRWGEEIWPQLE